MDQFYFRLYWSMWTTKKRKSIFRVRNRLGILFRIYIKNTGSRMVDYWLRFSGDFLDNWDVADLGNCWNVHWVCCFQNRTRSFEQFSYSFNLYFEMDTGSNHKLLAKLYRFYEFIELYQSIRWFSHVRTTRKHSCLSVHHRQTLEWWAREYSVRKS